MSVAEQQTPTQDVASPPMPPDTARRRADLVGECLCGIPLRDHYDAGNRKRPCRTVPLARGPERPTSTLAIDLIMHVLAKAHGYLDAGHITDERREACRRWATIAYRLSAPGVMADRVARQRAQDALRPVVLDIAHVNRAIDAFLKHGATLTPQPKGGRR